ncbi:hypothetical protein [Streptomyces sp. NBC_00500]|uniref:hypothetical protein n=1 Tax=Streptomyces sp. NBC_00500 TaxID=2975762 RepID=UPI0030E40496
MNEITFAWWTRRSIIAAATVSSPKTSPQRPKVGLEALPVRHRPATRAALTEAGFTGADLWRYMRAPLPTPDLPRLDRYTTERTSPDSRRLVVTEHGKTVAEAVIGTPVQGKGVLWWIGVEPSAPTSAWRQVWR